ncbi:MAG: hypothetical protein ABI688_07410, partial [Bacteroidota bacterium]
FTASVLQSNNQQVLYMYMDFTPNNKQKLWLNYHASGGYSVILKNKDLITIDLVMELSKTKFYRGFYFVQVPGKSKVSGDYSITGSYLGLSASYTRTGAKKKFKHLRLQ